MTEGEDRTEPTEERPAEYFYCNTTAQQNNILSRLDEYQLRVVLAFAEELLRD